MGVSRVSLSRTGTIVAVAAAVVTGGAGLAFAAPAPSPVHITCGEVITTSITVANNLTCPGDALSIQADGVTLDLGGHTIRGGGSGIGVEIISAAGPQINNVTITNGTIAHFNTAVRLFDSDTTTLSGLTLNANSGVSGPVIDTGRAIVSGLLVKNTHITNTPGDVIFAQLNVAAAFTDTRITGGNVFFSQTPGPTFTNDNFTNTSVTFNIEGFATVTGSKFTNSPVVNNGFGFGGDLFKNDTFSNAITALTLQDVPNQQLIGNTFSGNDIGVAISDSPGDTISGNTFSHNRTAGIYFVDTLGPIPAAPLLVTNNTAKFNGTHPDGTLDPGGVLVEGGIFLYTPHGGATITNNKTAHNGGYGIYALPPTPGTGTNTASGNVSIDDFGKCYTLSTCTYK